MKRVCKQCGKEFELTQSEISFYKSKNLALPKRCKSCRETNKETNKKNEKQEKQNMETSSIKSNVKKDIQNNTKNSLKSNKKGNSKIKYLLTVAFAVVAVLVYFLNGEFPTSTKDSYSNSETYNASSSTEESSNASKIDSTVASTKEYSFRSEELLNEHYEKHGVEMGFQSAAEYEQAAAQVVGNSEALHKTEAEDGDDVYYLEKTNEFVIVSTDGFIRTYFMPNDGIDYFNRQ